MQIAVVSNPRQVFMILNNSGEELKIASTLRFEGFDHMLFVSSAAMKCFSLRMEDH